MSGPVCRGRRRDDPAVLLGSLLGSSGNRRGDSVVGGLTLFLHERIQRLGGLLGDRKDLLGDSNRTLGVVTVQAGALFPQAAQAVHVTRFHRFGDELGGDLGLLLERLELQLGNRLQTLQGQRLCLESAVGELLGESKKAGC